jgi:TP901 family phage tail tape measure protein
MATLDETINIIINATDNASAVIANVGTASSDLSGKVSGLAAPFADLANTLLTAEAAIAAFALAIGTLAVSESIKFEDSLYNVKKQLGDSGITIDEARLKIEGLALQYGTNANDVAGSMADFLAAGNSYVNSAGLVETATKLMIAGQLDAQFATDAITKSLAGFKIPATDAAEGATKVGDVLNKIGDISSGKFEEIVEGFSRISPTAKDAGLSMEETAATIAVIVDVFGSGEIAATALKSGLLSLIDPSTGAKEEMTRLGVATTGSGDELLSAKTIITDLAGKFGTLTDSQKLQTAAIIFGKDQAGAMNALLGDWGKQQDYVAQMLDKTTGAMGSMEKEVTGKLLLISTSVDKANEAWRQFLENLGSKITAGGELQNLIDSAGELGVAFKTVATSGALDPLLEAFQTKFQGMSDVVSAAATNLPAAFAEVDWSGLTDSIDLLSENVKQVFSDFFGPIDLTTVDGLKTAIQLVIDTVESLTLTVAGIVAEFSPFAAAIGETVTHFNDLDAASKVDFGTTLGAMKLVVDAGVGLGLALVAIGHAGVDMSDVLDGVFGTVKIAINSLQLAFDSAVLGIVSLAQTSLGVLGFDDQAQQLQGIMDAIAANGVRNAGELEAGWNQAFGDGDGKSQAFRDTLDGTAEKLNQLKTATDPVATAMTDTADATAGLTMEQQLVTGMFGEFTDELDQMLTPLTGAQVAMDMMTASTEAAGNMTKTTREEGGYLYTAITDGTGAITYYSEKMKESTEAIDGNAKKTEEMTRIANDFQVKMEEIASNDRIKTIEAMVKLNTAELETDAERVKATFASLDNTITSTGTLLGSLFNSLISATSMSDKFKIERQIDKENKMRQEAFELQTKLAEAEIARVNAQTKALEKGDALITIDGTGLAPQLEAFMWEILKAIRVRANAEFADYLLGMGGATA